MANRQIGYGLTAEVSARIDAKYSKDDAKTVISWIHSLIGKGAAGPQKEAVHAWLKDGQILCEVMNKLSSGSCGKIHDISKVRMAAMKRNKEMENISFFLAAAEKYGVGKSDLFQTVDLYEDRNMAQVLTTMFKLSGVAMKKGHKAPAIGVKIADKNVRELDEEKLREGRSIIGLQMGTNKVASQEGMTPYGLGRQLTPQTKN